MLRYEFLKLYKSGAFFILLLVIVITGISLAFLFSDTNTVDTYMIALKDSGAIMLVVSIFAGIFFGNDFTNKTIQGSISCGISRILIFSSKAIVYFFVIVLFSIMYPLMMSITSNIFINSFEIIPLETIKTLIFMTIACVASNCIVASISIIIAFYFKSSATIIGVCLGISIAGNLISSLVMPFLAESMAYTPFSLRQIIFATDAVTADFIKVCILAIVYSIIFLTIAYGIFRKTELK